MQTRSQTRARAAAEAAVPTYPCNTDGAVLEALFPNGGLVLVDGGDAVGEWKCAILKSLRDCGIVDGAADPFAVGARYQNSNKTTDVLLPLRADHGIDVGRLAMWRLRLRMSGLAIMWPEDWFANYW